VSEITMPRLSDSMEQGTIVRWLKHDGDTVEVGEELVEIETDKATISYESEIAGVVKLVAQEGETVPVGGLIARVGDAATEPAPVRKAETTVETNGAVLDAPVAVAATPLARRVAAVRGVDLTGLVGTGPRGRITRSDVYAALGVAPPTQAPTPPGKSASQARASSEPELIAAGTPRYEDLTGLQKVVARRMTEAKATIPEFHVQTEVRMDALLALRARLKEQLAADAVLPSLNDLVVKASALALREHPRANSSFAGDRIAVYADVNIGVAVAADAGLVVPVVRNADTKSLGTIAAETRRLAERVRERSVTPEELSGGTFTVSNLGMFGMTAITPVINPPQAAILGVGAVRDVLAREDGRLVDRALTTLTLTCDHRILYGADAARFLSTTRELLENPLSLLL
jgi:pyruvate dehydrogenase E2 component (dihydrolipoamide acetyltransferase)